MTMDLKSEKPSAKTHVRVLLTDDEIQLSSVDDLCNKYFDWLKLSKESTAGRKTRATNRRADAIYDEIIAFKLPQISIAPTQTLSTTNEVPHENINSTKNSIGGDSDGSTTASSSGTTGRVLRPRCRTPSVSRKREASPSTPVHQNIRANMKKNLDSNSSNVLSAALNQQHPSVSVTKIRQLLRADSAQKKREEEKERQERVRLERKAKEERAEAQKKLLLEERAVTAKMKREQRLLHAAEVRKAREKAKIEQKLKEAIPNISKIEPEKNNKHHNLLQQVHHKDDTPVKPSKMVDASQKHQDDNQTKAPKVDEAKNKSVEDQPVKTRKLDETFQKPTDEHDNIDISVHDETTDEPTKKVNVVASWAKAPHLRDLVVAQFRKMEEELLKEAFELFGGVKLPVDLEQIFSSHKLPSNRRYLVRTSSAVWTPPHKPLKRTSSVVFTPTDQKR